VLLAGAAADVGADGVEGKILRGAMKPAGQNTTARQLRRMASEGDEDGLGHILGGLLVADHAQGGGINEIDVSADQIGKGGLRPVFGVIAQEEMVARSIHFTKE
jgi:hypothetical protein